MDQHSRHPEGPMRQTLRLANHDYASIGVYFVTICAERRDPLFNIPELRTILTETWYTLPNRFPTITLDEFVVMPDHVHCMLWLTKDTPDAPTLGKVMGAYKSLTTGAWLRHLEATNMNHYGRFWQRNYYERIIRDNIELEQTRTYIRNNPTLAHGTRTAPRGHDPVSSRGAPSRSPVGPGAFERQSPQRNATPVSSRGAPSRSPVGPGGVRAAVARIETLFSWQCTPSLSAQLCNRGSGRNV